MSETVFIFAKGLLTGFILCAPFGPVGVLCMRRTLLDGKTAGFFSVFGSSVVDLIYCSLAGLGIGYITDFLAREKEVLEIIAGILLVVLGALLIRRRSRKNIPDERIRGNLKAFSSMFFLTLAHPVPIIVFTAAFAAVGVPGWRMDPIGTGMLVARIFGVRAVGPHFYHGGNLLKKGHPSEVHGCH